MVDQFDNIFSLPSRQIPRIQLVSQPPKTFPGALEEGIVSNTTWFPDIKIQICLYRETGTFVIKGIDEISAFLDEQITITQAMQFSAFKGHFEERINRWERTLNTFSEVLDWVQVQRSWLYLQPIFDSRISINNYPQKERNLRLWIKIGGKR